MLKQSSKQIHNSCFLHVQCNQIIDDEEQENEKNVV